MPPKKKKAKDEGPPLTEEEKLLLAQAEAMRVRRASARRTRALRARENPPRHPSPFAASPSRRERRDAPPTPTPTPPLGQRKGTEQSSARAILSSKNATAAPSSMRTLTPLPPPPKKKAEEEARKAYDAKVVELRRRRLNEERLTRLNAAKVHNQWRAIMRLAKAEELRGQIAVAAQTHERQVDREDARIAALQRDVEAAEEQHQTAARAHLAVVDALVNLQSQRVRDLDDEFRRDARSLEEEFENERREISAAHQRQRKDLLELMRAMEEAHERAEHDAHAAFETVREEIKNRNGEEYNALKFSLEAAVEALEKHFEEAHRAYLGSTDTRAESFKRLTRQDATSAKTIERRMRRLIRFREQLATWRSKAETNRREWEERNAALRREKERVSAHYHALAESMRKFRAEARRKLSKLIADAGSAGEALDEKIAKAERLLKLGQLSRRLETEAERVAPFPLDGGLALDLGEEATEEERAVAAATARVRAADEATRLADAAGAEAEAEKRKQSAGASTGAGAGERDTTSAEGTHEHGEGSLSSWGADASGAPVPEHEYLERFFDRRNRAFLSERAVDRERRRLDRENEDLRAILKQYLDGVSVNEDVIGDPANPLFVVNDKVLRRQAERRAAAERGARRNDAGSREEAPKEVEVFVRAN